jgi:pyruvate, water dikinase
MNGPNAALRSSAFGRAPQGEAEHEAMRSSYILPLSAEDATHAARVGPKAANLAALARAGLPTPGGFCISAAAYWRQVEHLGLAGMVSEYDRAGPPAQRRLAVEIRLKLYQSDLAPDVLAEVLAAWWAERKPAAVRSSALIEDRADANFAGQFESFLGIADDAEFLTALRASWAALWTTNARRSMAAHAQSPGDTAMAVLVQPLVAARVSGGGLSETADGHMLLSATWGLGSTIAQGEVVPDRIVLSRHGFVRSNEAGRKYHRQTCGHVAGNAAGTAPQAVPDALVRAPCLKAGEATTLGRLMRKTETVLGMPVEIEWALDETGFRLLQARPLHMQPPQVPDEIWLKHPGLNGHPAGIGWGSGRAVVVNCECELARVAPGDILVTRVAGPALSHILPRVGGVVAELGGSTSHLASLARERGVPMVLGVLDATRRIPDGAQVAVDGVAGVVRWLA